MMLRYRIVDNGVMSYWRATPPEVAQVVGAILARNHSGYVELRNGEDWRVIGRFEPWYGFVIA